MIINPGPFPPRRHGRPHVAQTPTPALAVGPGQQRDGEPPEQVRDGDLPARDLLARQLVDPASLRESKGRAIPLPPQPDREPGCSVTREPKHAHPYCGEKWSHGPRNPGTLPPRRAGGLPTAMGRSARCRGGVPSDSGDRDAGPREGALRPRRPAMRRIWFPPRSPIPLSIDGRAGAGGGSRRGGRSRLMAPDPVSPLAWVLPRKRDRDTDFSPYRRKLGGRSRSGPALARTPWATPT